MRKIFLVLVFTWWCVESSLASTNLAEQLAKECLLQLFSAMSAAYIENTGQIADSSVRYVFNVSGANIFHIINGGFIDFLRRRL